MDLYVALGLGRGASLGEIRRAYRRLARRYHPEVNPGNDEAEVLFRRIVEAYETLSHPDKRRAYDSGVSLEVPRPAPEEVLSESPPRCDRWTRQRFKYDTIVSCVSEPKGSLCAIAR